MVEREPPDMRPDVGVLAGHLLFAFQRDLFERLAAEGHADLRPRHGIVMAYIDAEGTRASDLAQRSGRHKQVVGTIIDELERLGYVVREPDPSDRRAKLVVPTDLGRDQMVKAKRISRSVEQGYRKAVGADRFNGFADVLHEVVRAARSSSSS